MHSLWQHIIHSRAFWIAFLKASTDLSLSPTLAGDTSKLGEHPYCDVRLSFIPTSGHLLIMHVASGEHALELTDPDLSSVSEIARWDSHAMPHLLRLDEFESLTHAPAETAHPLWAVRLLFAPYVPVVEECSDAYQSMFRRCLDATKAFSGEEVEYLVGQVRVRQDFRWVRDPSFGWTPEGQHVHSLRRPTSDIDFAAFHSLLAAIGHA